MNQNIKVDYIKKVNIYKNGLPLWASIFLKTVFIVFIICCSFVAIFSFIYICTPVDGKSMLPTLNAQCYDEDGFKINGAIADSVYINRFADYDYGNIIVIDSPEEETNRYVIKRIIAKGGDKIAVVPTSASEGLDSQNRTYQIYLIKAGTTQVIILEEDYLPEGTSLYKTYVNLYVGTSTESACKEKHPSKFVDISNGESTISYLVVAENEFFYLGDNRNDSYDCSIYGPVSSEKYVGRVDIIVHESENHFSCIFLYFWHKIFG